MNCATRAALAAVVAASSPVAGGGAAGPVFLRRRQHLARIVMLWRREQVVKARHILRDGAGGAGDVVQVGFQRQQQRVLRRHLAALLRGPGADKLAVDAAKAGVIPRALAPRRECR